MTAQNHAQSNRKMPIAVTALSGDQVSKLGMKNAPDLTIYVASFWVTFERGATSVPNFSIPGMRGATASRLN
jgi:hypothetical protein